MPDALRLALGTLTALRVPAPRIVDRRTAGGAMLLAPVTALLLLVPGAVVVPLLRPWDRPALALPLAVALVAGLALSTRALHLDGLADTVDGLAASYDRERALAVMRTGDVGPAGAAALVLILLLQVTSAAALLHSPAGAATAAVAVLASRLALTWMCVGGRAARTHGLGATVVASVPALGAAVVTGVVVAAAAVVTGVVDGGGGAWLAGPLVVVAALVAAGVLRRLAGRRLGGLTGDLLGAVIEIACAAGLFIGVLTVA